MWWEGMAKCVALQPLPKWFWPAISHLCRGGSQHQIASREIPFGMNWYSAGWAAFDAKSRLSRQNHQEAMLAEVASWSDADIERSRLLAFLYFKCLRFCLSLRLSMQSDQGIIPKFTSNEASVKPINIISKLLPPIGDDETPLAVSSSLVYYMSGNLSYHWKTRPWR